MLNFPNMFDIVLFFFKDLGKWLVCNLRSSPSINVVGNTSHLDVNLKYQKYVILSYFVINSSHSKLLILVVLLSKCCSFKITHKAGSFFSLDFRVLHYGLYVSDIWRSTIMKRSRMKKKTNKTHDSIDELNNESMN